MLITNGFLIVAVGVGVIALVVFVKVNTLMMEAKMQGMREALRSSREVYTQNDDYRVSRRANGEMINIMLLLIGLFVLLSILFN